jgi:excisionase family DNA binding protein
MNQNQSVIMTVEETAEFLRVPISSVYKLAQQGKIPAQKVGRHWRFYRPALVNWVAGQSPVVIAVPASPAPISLDPNA